MTDGPRIRPLANESDYRQCVALQRLTWGEQYDELVPPSLLTVTQKIGGVAAGAFDESGRMLGFVFGMAGVRDGRIIHWSDMLAVRPEARDAGVGRALKAYQRDAARATGATTMYWSYDPLVARNAHLNFNRLGVRVDEYVEDMYGDSASELHRGLGTDRFIVAWPLSEVREKRAPPATDAPLLDVETIGAARPRVLRVEIPSDIVRVRDESPREAARWRASTRRAFQWALANGYEVAGFIAGETRGAYLLERSGEGR
jgi:predicted GNAT superfamily acetyltransferase